MVLDFGSTSFMLSSSVGDFSCFISGGSRISFSIEGLGI